jgi:hypothetical protein
VGAGVGHWACRPVSASTGCHWERRLETCLSFVFEELTGGDRDGVAGGDALFFFDFLFLFVSPTSVR